MAIPGEAFVAAAGALAVGLVLKFGRPDEEEPPTPTPIRPKPMSPVPTIYQNMLAKQNLIVPENNLILPQQQEPSWKVGLNQDFVNQVGSSPQDYLNPQRDMPLATKFLKAVTAGAGVPPKSIGAVAERLVYDSETKTVRIVEPHWWSESWTSLAIDESPSGYYMPGTVAGAIDDTKYFPTRRGSVSKPTVEGSLFKVFTYHTPDIPRGYFRTEKDMLWNTAWGHGYYDPWAKSDKAGYPSEYLRFTIMDPYDLIAGGIGNTRHPYRGDLKTARASKAIQMEAGEVPVTHIRLRRSKESSLSLDSKWLHRGDYTLPSWPDLVETSAWTDRYCSHGFEVSYQDSNDAYDAALYELASEIGQNLKIVLGSVSYDLPSPPAQHPSGEYFYWTGLHIGFGDTQKIQVSATSEVVGINEGTVYGPKNWTVHRLKPDNTMIPANLLDAFYASGRGRDNVLGHLVPEWIALEKQLRNVQQGLLPDGTQHHKDMRLPDGVNLYGVRLYNSA